MRLQRLTSLEVEKLQAELEELERIMADLKDILARPERILAIIKNELLELRDKYPSPRKTELSFDPSEIDIADLVKKEDVVISVTHLGYIKRLSLEEYKTQKRGGRGVTGHKPKEEDFVEDMFISSTHDRLLMFTNFGKVYRLMGYEIPEALKAARGRALVNLLPLAEGEHVSAVIPLNPTVEDVLEGEDGEESAVATTEAVEEATAESVESVEDVAVDGKKYIVMATRRGLIKKTAVAEFDSIRRNGKIAINLNEGDELISVQVSSGDDEILAASYEGKCIRFSEHDVRAMGRDTQGVRCMLISEEDRLVEMTVVKEGYDVLTISSLGFGKRSDIEDYRLQSRGGKGIKAGVFNDKTGTLVSLKLVKEDNDIMLIADNGIVIRTPACDISKIGRDTKGVKVMRIDGGRVVTVAVVAHQEDEKEEPVEGEESTETLVEGEALAEAVTEEVTEATAPASDEETDDSEE